MRYLSETNEYVDAHTFERGLDTFVEGLLGRLSSVGSAASELQDDWKLLRGERNDLETAGRRKLEALLGCDPNEAPEETLKTLRSQESEAGADAVEEVAAAAKTDAPNVLRSLVETSSSSPARMRFHPTIENGRMIHFVAPGDELPWQRADDEAMRARTAWGLDPGPISNEKLADRLGIDQSVLSEIPVHRSPFAAGYRTNGPDGEVRIALRSKWQVGRRFELMRLVADQLAAPGNDRLLPATTARTDRQQFQRAFAQEFLCPFEDIRNELGQGTPPDEDIDEMAQRYEVSPLLIRTVLVNKGLLSREALGDAL
ncbi:MAG: ImmA/IrrE family metallo-endopeptidase [Alphaproteobacteria bacterium]